MIRFSPGLTPISPNLKINMEEVNSFIDRNLSHQATSNKVPGRTHRLQQKGTCAIRSALSWLHGRIGSQLFRQVKPILLKEAIEKVQDVKAKWESTPLLAEN